MKTEAKEGSRPLVLFALLLRLMGAGLLVLAVVFNEFLLAWLDQTPPLRLETVHGVRQSQLWLAGIGLVLLGADWWLRRSTARRRPVSGWRINLALGLLLTLLPLFVLELGLRPLTVSLVQPTTIFMRDPDLDWRLRPNAVDTWGGTTVTINEKGLRGPAIPYERTPDTTRILFLGDSVTFGFALPEYDDAYPYQVEAVLEEQGFGAVETVNAGVGGYSPWQSYRYLVSEGYRYQPDLIVYGFVLNDVTEKFFTVRYGGRGQGYQLDNTFSNWTEWLTLHSSIAYYANRLGRRIRFGDDEVAGARAEEVAGVTDLVFQPDDPRVVEAWEITLTNLTDIVDFAAAEDIPLLLVAFPYTFQFKEEGRDAPQQVLGAYAAGQDIYYIDLMPPILDFMAERDLPATMIFFDDNHLTVGGSQLVGRLLAEPVQEALAGADE